MPRFRKKPVEIEARQWDGTVQGATPIIDWILLNNGTAGYYDEHEKSGSPAQLWIQTLEGRMFAGPGDFIIQGVQGEFYPCKPDIFDETYERVSD